jgi:FKBP-type peptidyl-prolyl cis-trans isomerase
VKAGDDTPAAETSRWAGAIAESVANYCGIEGLLSNRVRETDSFAFPIQICHLDRMPKPPVRSFFILLLLGVMLLTLALVVRSGMWARKNPGEPINSAMRLAMAKDQPELTTSESLLVEQIYPTAAVTKSGLRFVVRAPGAGPKAKAGDLATVHFAGRLLDGTPIDSSYQTGVPVQFRLGGSDILPAWNEGFLDMRKGEKRTLIAPYWLAYGLRGRPPAIPPEATIIFEVELLDFQP